MQKNPKLFVELSESDWGSVLRYLLACTVNEQLSWTEYQEITPAIMRLCAAIEAGCKESRQSDPRND